MSGKITDFMSDETRFLSNFYPYKKDGGKYEHIVKVIYNGIEFDCVENAYQAAKFLNKTEQMAFAKMSPYETKSFWENNSGFRSDWEQIKLSIMEDLVWQKFFNSDILKQKLLATEDAVLEEGNDWNDTFWGVCNGVGENHLGKILMNVRNKLKNKAL